MRRERGVDALVRLVFRLSRAESRVAAAHVPCDAPDQIVCPDLFLLGVAPESAVVPSAAGLSYAADHHLEGEAVSQGRSLELQLGLLHLVLPLLDVELTHQPDHA